jgi:polysaccharide pyruvyl transferase WcaK-like protein
MRSCVAAVYPVCDRVVVRGTASLEAARELAPADRLAWAPDAAFLLGPAPQDSLDIVTSRPGYYDTYPASAGGFDPRKRYVCLGASALYQDGPRADKGSSGWFEELTLELSREIQVVLCGHDFPDQQLFGPIARRTGLPLLTVQTSVTQVVDILGRASAYVGGRWHSAVLAATGGTPILRLQSNSSVKSRDLEDFIVPQGTVAASLSKRPTPTDVAKRTLQIVEREDALRAEGLERTADYRDRVLAHVQGIL